MNLKKRAELSDCGGLTRVNNIAFELFIAMERKLRKIIRVYHISGFNDDVKQKLQKLHSNTAVHVARSCSLFFRIPEPLGGRWYAYKSVWRKLVHALPTGYHYSAVYGGYRFCRLHRWHWNIFLG